MNVLIVGLGSIAKKHIAAVRNCVDHVKFYALRSSDSATPYEDIRNVGSLAELNTIKIEFAIVSNPTSLHVITIKQLLSLNCPLFIEKPLADSLNVDNIIAEVQEKGIITYVGCNLRFLDSIKFVKEQLNQGTKRLNEVNIYCGSYLPEWRPGDFKNYYSTKPELGGGVHLDLIHELDYVYWLFGIPANVSRIFTKNSSIGVEVYDYANFTLVYESFSASVILNYYRKDTKRTFELVFSDETWEVDLVQNSVVSGGRILYQSGQTIAETYYGQMSYFIENVKKDKPSFNSIEDSYNVLKICLSH
jgi:predicted dehydrogenase